VLEGTVPDDSWFAFIAAADENDDWTDPEVWRKANPNFGLSVKQDDLTRKAEKAIALPGAQNAFRRMHLNEWTEQAERWIDLAAWDACDGPVHLELLRGRPCFGGLDLSATTDITALAWVFPPHRGGCSPATSYLRRTCASAPSATACPTTCGPPRASSRRPRAMSSTMAPSSSGSLPTAPSSISARSPTTPGTPPTSRSAQGATMIEFRQGFRSMAAPTRELEKLIVSRQLAHGGNPVTRWMAANVAVAQDPAGNLKPAKDKSTERIDGIVALIMAIGRAMVVHEEPQPSYQMVIL
jgi:phage terminase large subunit-like protein